MTDSAERRSGSIASLVSFLAGTPDEGNPSLEDTLRELRAERTFVAPLVCLIQEHVASLWVDEVLRRPPKEEDLMILARGMHPFKELGNRVTNGGSHEQ